MRYIRLFVCISCGLALSLSAQVAAQTVYAANQTMPVTLPHSAIGHGAKGSLPQVDPDGFVYTHGGELARLDLREIAKGDYFLAKLDFSSAIHAYTTAYEAGNRSPYLRTQLGIVSHLRGDNPSARIYLAHVVKGIPADKLNREIPAPFRYGYATPTSLSETRMVSVRTNLSVVFYLLNAQYDDADFAGYVSTARKFYNSLVENDHVLLTLLAEALMEKKQYTQALVEVNKALLMRTKNSADFKTAYRVKGQLLTHHLRKKKDGAVYLNKAAALGDEKAAALLK